MDCTDLRKFTRSHKFDRSSHSILRCALCGAEELTPLGCVTGRGRLGYSRYNLCSRWINPNTLNFVPSFMVIFKQKEDDNIDENTQILSFEAVFVHPEVCPVLVEDRMGTKQTPVSLQ